MTPFYRLAQTYAPTEEFARYMAVLPIEAAQFCKCIGIHPSTFERIQRQRTTSRKTAERVATGFAMIHGSIQPRQAFALLFTPREHVFMDANDDGKGFRRRRDD